MKKKNKQNLQRRNDLIFKVEKTINGQNAHYIQRLLFFYSFCFSVQSYETVSSVKKSFYLKMIPIYEDALSKINYNTTILELKEINKKCDIDYLASEKKSKI